MPTNLGNSKPDVFISVEEAYTEKIKQSKEYKTVESYGGEVKLIERQSPFVSSTKVIHRMIGSHLKDILEDYLEHSEKPIKERFGDFKEWGVHKMNDGITKKDQKQKDSRVKDWYGEIWTTVGKCVFCDLKDRYVIKRYKKMVLTTNLYPYIDGHLMILPESHKTKIKELTTSEWKTIRTLHYVAQKMLKVVLKVKNSWFICREGTLGDDSQKTVDHLHFHVLPYEPGLVEWNYKKVKHPAAKIAKSFRKGDDLMDRLIKRFNEKYNNSK